MKLFFLFVTCSWGVLSASAQQLQFNAPDPLPHGSYGDIHASPGILGDHYYILYNEMARKVKGDKDPGDAYLKIYSIEKGTLLHSINLDSLALKNTPDKNILFADLLIWKGRFLGVYASWTPSGTWVNLYAQLYDPEGNMVGNPRLLETISPLESKRKKTEKVATLDGKDVLDLTKDVQYRFNRDSSRVALYYAAHAWKGFRPTLLGPDLQHPEKWAIDLGDRDQLLTCVPEGKDSLFALVKQAAPSTDEPAGFRLLAYTPGNVSRAPISIEIPKKIIQDASFSFSKDGSIVVTGTYTLPGRALNATYGVFALQMNTAGKGMHTDIRPFQGAMISDLESYKAAAKEKGLQGIIRVSKIIPLAGEGMVSVGRSTYQGTEVTAYPIVLAPHYDAGGNIVLTGVSSKGEIKWISYLKRFYENYPSTTMPTPFYAARDQNSHLVVVYDENGEQRTKQQIFIDRYGDKGIQDRDWMALPKSFNTRSTWILWNTACQTDHDAIMVAYYNTWKKELGTLKIGLRNGMRLTANP